MFSVLGESGLPSHARSVNMTCTPCDCGYFYLGRCREEVLEILDHNVDKTKSVKLLLPCIQNPENQRAMLGAGWIHCSSTFKKTLFCLHCGPESRVSARGKKLLC